MSLTLASGSPRRIELLKMIGIHDFIVVHPETKEQVSDALPPDKAVCEIALAKIDSVLHLCNGDNTIVAADTLVFLDGSPLGKPIGSSDACRMLSALSGRKHSVYTGVAVRKGCKCVAFAEKTDVFFRRMSLNEINAYVESKEPMDKAGAYGAQGLGAVFIERIEGDFFNVMGLPICKLSTVLMDFGINDHR